MTTPFLKTLEPMEFTSKNPELHVPRLMDHPKPDPEDEKKEVLKMTYENSIMDLRAKPAFLWALQTTALET